MLCRMVSYVRSHYAISSESVFTNPGPCHHGSRHMRTHQCHHKSFCRLIREARSHSCLLHVESNAQTPCLQNTSWPNCNMASDTIGSFFGNENPHSKRLILFPAAAESLPAVRIILHSFRMSSGLRGVWCSGLRFSIWCPESRSSCCSAPRRNRRHGHCPRGCSYGSVFGMPKTEAPQVWAPQTRN